MERRFGEAVPEYQQYLKLSNFDSSAFEKFGYYAIGFKFFTKKRAATQDVWKELRGLTYYGLCESERRINHYDNAISYCQRALSFDKEDPLTHYSLALAYFRMGAATGDVSLLPAAR